MKILLLNVSYAPLELISLEEAICKVYSGEVFLEGDSKFCVAGGTNVHGERSHVVLSPVVRNKTYDKRPAYNIPFSRRILFMRDKNTCVYCGRTIPKGLTRDHVIPKAALYHPDVRNRVPQSKRHLVNPSYIHGWGNSVTSCKRCNREKGHSIPDIKHIKERKTPCLADMIYLGLNREQKKIFTNFITPFLKVMKEKEIQNEFIGEH